MISRSVTVIKFSSLKYKGLKLTGTEQSLTMLCIIDNINNFHLTYGIDNYFIFLYDSNYYYNLLLCIINIFNIIFMLE
mgnify:CR=1 FL=1